MEIRGMLDKIEISGQCGGLDNGERAPAPPYLFELMQRESTYPYPDGYVFTSSNGAAIDESNFYHREWLAMLRRLKIRPRRFYNTWHSYISFMLSSGHSALFVSKQTGGSIKTLETNYAGICLRRIPGTQ